ncbi:CLUMA_CG015672, isoform A [Clunio marinus]|uniref:CLUMA_CG015672, isoform A n=1 Tax=Clunio marinus TaxID=568069 RepID=A0A1J1IRR2_9DIPT|nr:CLUMA_CG015672, isoform A [Clunio marinus]
MPEGTEPTRKALLNTKFDLSAFVTILFDVVFLSSAVLRLFQVACAKKAEMHQKVQIRMHVIKYIDFVPNMQ